MVANRRVEGTVETPQPCRCHSSWASVSPLHQGHCCFFPATQTCHPAEVAEWERKRTERLRYPGRAGRTGVDSRA